MEKLVVIGAGMASGRMLDHLFAADPDAYDVTLFNAEPRGNYNRLMLSPVLAGDKTYDEIVTHDAAWYAAHNVTCRFGEKVLSVDTQTKTVHGEQGALPYDRLVLATGSTPFMIPLPGHDLKGVIPYRDLEDTETMMALGHKPGARAVVIGGGLLGLEAAAGMAARGVQVTVVHIMGHLMERQLDPAAGGLLRRSLQAKGIEVLCEANSKEILADETGHVRALLLEDGTELPCDLLVMAVGIRPATTLAKASGIPAERGIVVNDQMATGVPDVYALGECVEHHGALFGLVAPLYDQAQVLANTLLGVADAFVPKELSTTLKVTGCDLFSAGDFADGDGRENIILQDPSKGIYKRLVLEGDRMIGAVMYGETGDGAWFYKLIKDGTNITPMRDMLIFGPDFSEDIPDLPRAAA